MIQPMDPHRKRSVEPSQMTEGIDRLVMAAQQQVPD
jgi:hypothetical protein